MNPSAIARRVLRDDTVVLNPGRTLDNTNAHEMVAAITDAQAAGYRFIIIDMDDLRFLSSAGVGSILGTIETCRDRGGDLILCRPSDNIRHVLEVLDLMDYLTVTADEKQAAARAGIEL